LRQTVARAEALRWASLSDVARLKRLRASANWLEYLCSVLWGRMEWPEGLQVRRHRWRIVDATTIQEPGALGLSWRVHYSIRLPSLACDFISITGVRGGETLCRVPIRPGEVILADRGYSHRPGVAWVMSQGGQVIVRYQGPIFPVLTRSGQKFELLKPLRSLSGHQPAGWAVVFEQQGRRWPVWLHAVRKSATAAERAKRELRREHGEGVQPETLELAEYVVVLTSLSPKELTTMHALSLYRGRWQIELIFKTLKQLLGIGDLAKYDPDSARAWMQAKLLTALLIERLEREARFFSPWGFPLLGAVRLARVSGDAGQPLASDCPGATAAAVAGGGPADSTEVAGTQPAESTAGGSINDAD